MSSEQRLRRPEDRTAAGRFLTGALVGIGAGIVGLVLPIGLILLAEYEPAALLPLSGGLIQATSILALVAAVLFVVSLLFYRRAFAALRALDPRFWTASALCLAGTVGFLLLIVTAAIALSSSSAIGPCLHGSPTHIPSCLRSAAPSAAYSGSLGIVLVWVGGIGVVIGLAMAGRRLGRSSLYGGAAAYALLLVVLAGPLLAVLYPLAGLSYLVLATPLLVLLAPTLVADGSRRALGR